MSVSSASRLHPHLQRMWNLPLPRPRHPVITSPRLFPHNLVWCLITTNSIMKSLASSAQILLAKKVSLWSNSRLGIQVSVIIPVVCSQTSNFGYVSLDTRLCLHLNLLQPWQNRVMELWRPHPFRKAWWRIVRRSILWRRGDVCPGVKQHKSDTGKLLSGIPPLNVIIAGCGARSTSVLPYCSASTLCLT